jgi:hypothetical protein
MGEASLQLCSSSRATGGNGLGFRQATLAIDKYVTCAGARKKASNTQALWLDRWHILCAVYRKIGTLVEEGRLQFFREETQAAPFFK